MVRGTVHVAVHRVGHCHAVWQIVAPGTRPRIARHHRRRRLLLVRNAAAAGDVRGDSSRWVRAGEDCYCCAWNVRGTIDSPPAAWCVRFGEDDSRAVVRPRQTNLPRPRRLLVSWETIHRTSRRILPPHCRFPRRRWEPVVFFVVVVLHLYF